MEYDKVLMRAAANITEITTIASIMQSRYDMEVISIVCDDGVWSAFAKYQSTPSAYAVEMIDERIREAGLPVAKAT